MEQSDFKKQDGQSLLRAFICKILASLFLLIFSKENLIKDNADNYTNMLVVALSIFNIKHGSLLQRSSRSAQVANDFHTCSKQILSNNTNVTRLTFRGSSASEFS